MFVHVKAAGVAHVCTRGLWHVCCDVTSERDRTRSSRRVPARCEDVISTLTAEAPLTVTCIRPGGRACSGLAPPTWQTSATTSQQLESLMQISVLFRPADASVLVCWNHLYTSAEADHLRSKETCFSFTGHVSSAPPSRVQEKLAGGNAVPSELKRHLESHRLF